VTDQARSSDASEKALAAYDLNRNSIVGRAKLWLFVLAALLFYGVSWRLAEVDLSRLASGLPKLGQWLVRAWPPNFSELPIFIQRVGETVAMAAIGTTVATLLAIPIALLATRNLTPFPALYLPARWLLNALRGIDAFVFALLFVASVGLGPFAGVIGIALHTCGSAAKLIADAAENAKLDALHAIETTGASRIVSVCYALVPDLLPVVLSSMLYLFEFNVRASTVLGVVGAGGIGQELKNSMDLLDFPRLFTIIILIFIVVTVLDQLSGWLRKRLT
jgi:phosphonate transport system permease protein